MLERVKGLFGRDATEVPSLDEVRSENSVGGVSGSITLTPRKSSVASTAVNWVSNGAMQGNPKLINGGPTGDALLRLLARPGPKMSGPRFLKLITEDLLYDGTAYAVMESPNGIPVRLTRIPPRGIEHKFDSRGVLTSYVYTPVRGGNRDISVDDMMVFKYGESTVDNLTGQSPLALLPPILFLDDKLFRFIAYVAKNAKSGVVVSVARQRREELALSREDVVAVTKMVEDLVTSTDVGKSMTSPVPVNVSRLEPQFQDLDTTRFHNIVEERICAALGIQPSVVGFGTGVHSTRIGATALENKRESWRSGVLPLIRILGETFTQYLVPKFTDDPTTQVVIGTDDIPDLQPFSTDEVIRLQAAGIINESEARQLLRINFESEE